MLDTKSPIQVRGLKAHRKALRWRFHPGRVGRPRWYPGRAGSLRLGPKVLGAFGELHSAVIEALDARPPVTTSKPGRMGTG
jgi:phenylalanyl-tRNA synthetase beta subunit